jgi:hypothetical protein
MGLPTSSDFAFSRSVQVLDVPGAVNQQQGDRRLLE